MQEGKYLITTDNFFYAPDGQQYRAAWGYVRIVKDDALGIKTNRISSNWYAVLGEGDGQMIIAGCQIHYAIRCESQPSLEPYIHEELFEGKMVKSESSNRIYIAQYE